MECVVYMGSEDVKRQAPNVYRMKLLGATVVPVETGSKTLKDALNEAMRDWVTNVENTFYIIGTVAGPHPYPMMVRDFQRVIGDECLRADAARSTGRQPDARDRLRRRRLATRWASSIPTSTHADVRLIGVEAAGHGLATRQARGVAVRRQARACCTATAPTCCRTRTARSSRRIRSRPASTIPASAPSTRG